MDHLISNPQQDPTVGQLLPHDCFEARPSPRVGKGVQADGDTWQETLAVCEAPNGGKLVIRSYYQNTRSGKRVWDEPPSGASRLKPATEEMRRMAQLQLQEMQVVTGAVMDTPTSSNNGKNTPSPRKKGEKGEKSKKGVGGFFFRRKNKEKDKKNEKSDTPTIQYKAGSTLLVGGGRKPAQSSSRAHIGDEVNDLRMQEAIARSIAEANGIPYVRGGGNDDGLSQFINTSQEEEELEMAKALSMSEAEVHGEVPRDPFVTSAKQAAPAPSSWPQDGGEDFLLRQALEESRKEAQRHQKGKKNTTASEEKQEVDDLLSQFTNMSSPMMMNVPNIDPWPDDDVKPAAAAASPSSSKQPPLSQAVGQKPSAGLKSPPSYSSNPVTTTTMPMTPTSYGTASPAVVGGLKSPPSFVPSPTSASASSGGGRLKSPPSYALNGPTTSAATSTVTTNGGGGLKALPSYAAQNGVGLVAPLTPTPIYNSTTTPMKAAQSPVAMFDPYAKDAPSPTARIQTPALVMGTLTETGTNTVDATGQALHKLSEEDGQRARLHFGRRSSTKRMQDQAGVV